jgi:hypothetical protein
LQLAVAREEEEEMAVEDVALARQLEQAQREATEARELVAEERARIASLEQAKAEASKV